MQQLGDVGCKAFDTFILNPGARVVLDVDGSKHYADNREASPAKYAIMPVEDRKLRLDGYEVYRFGAA